MKKVIVSAFIIFEIGICFSSCSSSDNKIILLKNDTVDSFVYLNEEELDNKLYAQENFLLVVGENGCSTCEVIKPVFKNYISRYHYLINWVELDTYQTNAKKYNLKEDIYSSTILIFNKGNILQEIPYSDNIYYNLTGLETELNKYISNTNLYSSNDYVSYAYSKEFNMFKEDLKTTNDLDKVIKESQEVTILYYWDKCKDCIEFYNDFFNDYEKTNQKKIYTYNVDYLRNKKDDEGQPDLAEFKEFAIKYQFASYREGKVPTFITYKNSVKDNMIVYLNEEILESNNKFKVIESYYPELVNKESDSSVTLHNELKEYELNKIKSYLDNLK